MPCEVIVADDGSTDDTTQVVTAFARHAAHPVHLVRQEHQGFRVARLRNLAMARATGDYLIFVDGDMWLHREFLADHLALAARGRWTQGARIPLDAAATERALAAGPDALLERPELPGGTRRRLYAVRAPRAAALLRTPANAFIAVKACNMAAWRDDLIAVNGFNEEFVGWGPEDKELAARLEHHGVRRQTLLFGGIAWHLHHPSAPRDRHRANLELYARTRAQRLVRCARGLDAHM